MSESQRIDPQHPDPALVHRAAALLREGRLVAYPTETFYALGADPRSPRAIDAVFEAKGRPERLALPLIAADRRSVLDCVSELSDAAERLATAFWPGALTLVLPASPSLPPRLLGNGRTVGIRISSHPIAAALAGAFGSAIVATSANRSGQGAPTIALEVAGALRNDLALVLDGGATLGGQASTVLDMTSDPPRVVRAGAVALSAIEEVLGRRLA